MQGTLLGNYRVVEQLGEGGMGVVYVGRHETLGRRVVIKVLRPEMSRHADMLRRFFNEAQAATAIRHPGIVQVFDFGTAPEGCAFIVMELLEGQTLTARLEQRKLDATECCRIGRQIANALQAAHTAGITHRDLKPDNLFLVPDTEVIGGERVKVLDFGVAKLAGELHAAGVQTRTDVIMGTPRYMSPEQCRSAVAAEPRSDIYSLGCILFEMACGRTPFVVGGIGDMISAHLHTAPPSPQSLAPDLPNALAELIVNLLAKQPNARPQTMAAVSQSLDEILRGLGEVLARPPTSSSELEPTLPSDVEPTHLDPASPSERVTAPVPVPRSKPLPAPTPRPPPAPLPPLSPISTTLGSSAGMSGVPPRAGRHRLPFVLSGLAVVVAGTATVNALSADDPASQEPSISYDKIVASSRHEDAEVVESPRDAPTAILVDAAEAVSPPVRVDALETECQAYQTDRKWAELEQCADKLKPLAPERAAELRTRAVEEAKAAPRIAAFQAALRNKDLKQAKAALDQVWSDSVEYASLKHDYELAEAQAITDLATQLRRVTTSNCEQYNALLSKERASNPAPITAEAARRAPCSPKLCIGEAFAEKGREQFSAGQLPAALTSYEAAYACRPVPEWAEMAFVISCDLTNLSKARLYWRQLLPLMKSRAVVICVRNGISETSLRAP